MRPRVTRADIRPHRGFRAWGHGPRSAVPGCPIRARPSGRAAPAGATIRTNPLSSNPIGARRTMRLRRSLAGLPVLLVLAAILAGTLPVDGATRKVTLGVTVEDPDPRDESTFDAFTD